jgi:hypothetical protein
MLLPFVLIHSQVASCFSASSKIFQFVFQISIAKSTLSIIIQSTTHFKNLFTIPFASNVSFIPNFSYSIVFASLIKASLSNHSLVS